MGDHGYQNKDPNIRSPEANNQISGDYYQIHNPSSNFSYVESYVHSPEKNGHNIYKGMDVHDDQKKDPNIRSPENGHGIYKQMDGHDYQNNDSNVRLPEENKHDIYKWINGHDYQNIDFIYNAGFFNDLSDIFRKIGKFLPNTNNIDDNRTKVGENYQNDVLSPEKNGHDIYKFMDDHDYQDIYSLYNS